MKLWYHPHKWINLIYYIVQVAAYVRDSFNQPWHLVSLTYMLVNLQIKTWRDFFIASRYASILILQCDIITAKAENI